MENPSHNEAEIHDCKYENSFGFIKSAETNQPTSMSLKDPETILSMVVLLLTCLALAALAHVIV